MRGPNGGGAKRATGTFRPSSHPEMRGPACRPLSCVGVSKRPAARLRQRRPTPHRTRPGATVRPGPWPKGPQDGRARRSRRGHRPRVRREIVHWTISLPASPPPGRAPEAPAPADRARPYRRRGETCHRHLSPLLARRDARPSDIPEPRQHARRQSPPAPQRHSPRPQHPHQPRLPDRTGRPAPRHRPDVNLNGPCPHRPLRADSLRHRMRHRTRHGRILPNLP